MSIERPMFSFDFYKKSADYIKSKLDGFEPEIGLILGTGLGNIANLIDAKCIIDYKDIPNFLVSKAPGHAGKLVIGTFEGKKVVCMQGRFHSYDGYHFEELTIPVRVLKLLGIKKLILTNASGAINVNFRPGDLMLMTDHIKLSGSSPMRGPNIDEFGDRFFDCTNVYDPELRAIAKDVAKTSRIHLVEGVYFFLPGPQFETPAEIRAERILGGDVTGMSTVPEALTAKQCGIPCVGFSLVTNMASGVLDQPLTVAEVEESANRVAPMLLEYMSEFIRRI